MKSWYEKGETWGTKFGAVSSPYEECRAEAAGYFLCCYDHIMKLVPLPILTLNSLSRIFGYEGEEAAEVRYANWLIEIRAGLMGLETYSPETHSWGQVRYPTSPGSELVES